MLKWFTSGTCMDTLALTDADLANGIVRSSMDELAKATVVLVTLGF